MDELSFALLSLLAGLALGLSLAATYLVVISTAYTRRQKLLQYAAIWLLPLLGASTCIVVAGSDRRPPPPPRKEEFYEGGM